MKVLVDLHCNSHLLIDVSSMEMLETLCNTVSVTPVYSALGTSYVITNMRGPSFSILSTADVNKITQENSTDE